MTPSTKYHPDVIYFDEHAGDSQVDLGVHMGLGFLRADDWLANYYNKSLQWNHGKMEVVHQHQGRGRALRQLPEQRRNCFLTWSVRWSRAPRRSSNRRSAPIPSRPRLDSIADWHYKTGSGYTDAATLVTTLMQNVSRNGTMLLNLTQHGRGELDPQCIQIAQGHRRVVEGQWRGCLCFTSVRSRWATAPSLHAQQRQRVCHAVQLERRRDHTPSAAVGRRDAGNSLQSRNARLDRGDDVLSKRSRPDRDAGRNGAARCRGSPNQTAGVEDAASCASPTTRAGSMTTTRGRHRPGGFARCNLGTGDYNNDLTISNTARRRLDVDLHRAAAFRSSRRKRRAPGRSRFKLTARPRDGGPVHHGRAPAAADGVSVTGLTAGNHAISIVNRGPGPVAVDAIVGRP